MVKYEWQTGKGMAFLPELGGGGNFLQAYCMRLNSASTSNKVEFTDDVILLSEKKGLLQVVTFLDSPKTIQATRDVLSLLDEASRGAVKGEEATFFCQRHKTTTGSGYDGTRQCVPLGHCGGIRVGCSQQQWTTKNRYSTMPRESIEILGTSLL
ncbi:hypothetical protein BGZ61DRAFT_55836 [Ilyonectria robusta]|uniref:uncharacterized protein n=1 Tax=Ilyonectria robusta TaxID=1079257 RepID=UPI001E8E856A|nr:uncharacterized protein BGZ61DRAFT_55836 [Ilyonectria robusta]KAH8685144.1 hypothetical protein BGZ61DRAFT_55836 [Ilyonectria robusta]